jgi:Ca2+-binding RTX toxin-like protein
MALKIEAFDADNNGTGIDVTSYFIDFDTTYLAGGDGKGKGFFSGPSGMSGNEYATSEQQFLTSDTSKQSVVFDAGGTGASLDYDLGTHTVSGDLEAMTFGYGLDYNGNDYFLLTQIDLKISGFGIVNQAAGGTLESLIGDTMAGNISILTNFLNANSLEFVGSSGADTFKGYAKDDTITGGDGSDTLSGGGGSDTLTGGSGADTFIVEFATGEGNDVIIDTDGTLKIGHTSSYTLAGNATLVSGTTFELVVKDAGNVDQTYTLQWTGKGEDLVITKSGVAGVTVTVKDFENNTFGINLPVNDAPVAVNDDAGATSGLTPLVIDVLANDSDADGTLDPATVAVSTAAGGGTTSVNTSTGEITYTAKLGAYGTDTFKYTVKDDDAAVSNAATVSVYNESKLELTSGKDSYIADAKGMGTGLWIDAGDGDDYVATSNLSPSGFTDKIFGGEGNDIIFTGAGNDYLEGGNGNDVLRAGGGIDTSKGGDGDDVYGLRFFTATGTATVDTGTTTIYDDNGKLWNGTVTSAGVYNGFEITGTATVVTPGEWTLTVAGNVFSIEWAGDGTDLTVSGGTLNAVIKDYTNGTFGLTLENAAPVAVNDDAGATSGVTPLVIDVLANDSDADGTLDSATVAVTTAAGGGTTSVNTTTGEITYTAKLGAYGVDSFKYTVKDDDTAVSNIATVSVYNESKLDLTSGKDSYIADAKGMGTGLWIDAGDGDDYVATSNLSPSGFTDKIFGGEGNDIIFTGAGNDYLEGGNGNDVLRAGAGTDTSKGGAGDDVYGLRFYTATGTTTVDAGTTTIYDDDGKLWNGTVTSAGVYNGFEIKGTASLVSAGVWTLNVAGNTFGLAWAGAGEDLIITGGTLTAVVKDYTNGTFGLTLGNGNYIVGTDGNDTINAGYTPPATNSNDTIIGKAGNDTILGLDGDDHITGGAGTDNIQGGEGNDSFYIEGTDGQNDVMNGGNGTDTLYIQGTTAATLAGFSATNSIEVFVGNSKEVLGTSGNDTFNFTGLTSLTGVSFFDGDAGNDSFTTKDGINGDYRGGLGNDTFVGGSGKDTFTGGAGVDNLNGGAGDDTLIVSGTDDVTDTLNGGLGNDTLKVSGSTDLTLTNFDGAAQSIEIWSGNSKTLLGTSGVNKFDLSALTTVTGLTVIDGGAGNDIIKAANTGMELRGGAGVDTLTGGTGADTFLISGTNDTTDVINGGGGTDTIKVGGATAVTLVGFNATAQSIEVWQGTGQSLLGTTAANTFDLSGLTNIAGLGAVDGAAGNDTIVGSDSDDRLIGGAGVDNVDSGDGEDTVVISGTNDTTDVLKGGADDDTIEVTGTTAVTLAAFDATAQSFEHWVGNNKELLGTTAANVFDLSGLKSATGLLFVNGAAGNDIITGSDLVSLDLRGDAGDDTLNAGDAGDTLTGGAGKDTLNGGVGNDTLVISGTNDTLDVLNGGGGTDTIKVDGKTAVTLAALDTVASSIEVWQGNSKELLGTTANNTIDLSNLTGVSGLTFVDGGTGNDVITGTNAGSIDLRGGAGDDTLNAGDAGDTLNGGAGNDTLNGGAGNDTFIGGAGADTIVGGGGIDTVSYAGSAAVVVNLRTGFATGGDATGDKLTGIRNVIGTSNADTITASAAGSVINGGAGIDTLLGGVGDDTFIISGTNDTSDIRDGNAGTDTVTIVGSNATLLNFVAAYEDIEEFDGGGFSLLGTTAANTFDFTNVTVSNLIAVDAGAGNDTLVASDLTGMTLIGGAGIDTVTGGALNDTIVVSGTNDTTDVINGGGGTDTLKVNGTTALTLAGFNATAQSIEVWQGNNKELLGTTANNTFDLWGLTGVSGLTFVDGRAGNDTIIGTNAWAGDLRGGAGNDRIQGGSLIDTLAGGAGNDTFVFIDAAQGRDVFTDFANGDKLEIDKAAFAGGLEGLADGALFDAAYLVVGAGAAANSGAHGQFIYDTTTDILSWDADGTGAGAAVEIGKFGSSVVLKLADFTLV